MLESGHELLDGLDFELVESLNANLGFRILAGKNFVAAIEEIVELALVDLVKAHKSHEVLVGRRFQGLEHVASGKKIETVIRVHHLQIKKFRVRMVENSECPILPYW